MIVGVAAVTTVTVAVAVTEVSATEVAVMTTVLLGQGTAEGAVYTPVVEPIVPASGVGHAVVAAGGVGSDQVTFSQVGFDVRLHPGLLTVALNRKCSFVPTVAVVCERVMLIPVTIVRLAVAVFVVSACAVPVMVTAGAGVGVPPEVVLGVVGIVAGAVYRPVASIEPQVLAATLVVHVTLQLMAVLLLPVTLPLNC